MDPERTRVIHRDLNRTYPTLVRGEGIYLFDDEGNRYIDGSGGSAAVTAIGHGVPEVVNALAEQAARLAYAPTHAFTTEAIESCARIIIEEFAPEGFGKVWFVSGGSEATENAVKMAIQYHRERGNGSRHLVIGRRSSFHGATIAALAFGGNAATTPTVRRDPAARRTYLAMQPVSLPRERRLSRVRSLLRRRARVHHPPGRRGQRRRVHRRAGRGATLGAVPATAGVFPAHPRDLRPLRRPLYRRRGDDRVRPYRPPLGARSLGCGSRSDRLRQGDQWWLCPARGCARQTRVRGRGAFPQWLLRHRAYLVRQPDVVCRRSRGAPLHPRPWADRERRDGRSVLQGAVERASPAASRWSATCADLDSCLASSSSATERRKNPSHPHGAYRRESGMPPSRAVWCRTQARGPPTESRAITCSMRRR